MKNTSGELPVCISCAEIVDDEGLYSNELLINNCEELQLESNAIILCKACKSLPIDTIISKISKRRSK